MQIISCNAHNEYSIAGLLFDVQRETGNAWVSRATHYTEISVGTQKDLVLTAPHNHIRIGLPKPESCQSLIHTLTSWQQVGLDTKLARYDNYL